jgi:hypothetical protein
MVDCFDADGACWGGVGRHHPFFVLGMQCCKLCNMMSACTVYIHTMYGYL